MKENIIFITVITIIIFIIFPRAVYAQGNNLDAAYNYTVVDPEAQDGDILIYTDKGLTRANSAFSTTLFGVLQTNPVIEIQLSEDEGQPVVRSGVANVNVVNTSGPVKKGDYITSSAKPGKGQKADKSGYMLGVALADSGGSGQIPVALDIKYVDIYSTLSPGVNKFLKSLDNILLASTQNPEQFTKLIRYLAAAAIVLGAFVISLFTFSRSMANSVEAIGRNPLAKKSIYFSLMLNVIVTVTTLIAGLATAFILIKL